MNPSVDDQIIRDAYDDDSAAAAAEYGADFRRDVEPFLSREMVEAVIISGRDQLPPDFGYRLRRIRGTERRHPGFDDPGDHPPGRRPNSARLCAQPREEPRCHLTMSVREFAAICQGYRITTITGDRYAGEWPRERFRAHGLSYSIIARAQV